MTGMVPSSWPRRWRASARSEQGAAHCPCTPRRPSAEQCGSPIRDRFGGQPGAGEQRCGIG